MFAIGEKINGMFRDVNEAIRKKDKTFIQELAVKQVAGGAGALDVSLGAEFKDSREAMEWLVKSVGEATNAVLCIDSPKIEIIECGLKFVKSPAIINSSSAEAEKLDKYLKLAKSHNSSLIALTMDEKGLPQDIEGRLALAMKIIEHAEANEFSLDKIYFDPLLMPINVAQAQAGIVINTIRELQVLASPPLKTIVGLSNASQNAKNRKIINRTLAVLLLEAGLSAAILDPLDKELMDTIKTTEIILNKTIYCDSFLKLN